MDNTVSGELSIHILSHYETGSSMLDIHDPDVKISFQRRGIGKLIQYLLE